MKKNEYLAKNREKYIKERLSRVKNKTREIQLIADDLFLNERTVREIVRKISDQGNLF